MKLFEYEAKRILKEHGIAVPRGNTVTTPEEAEKIAREIGKPVVLKAQILVAGRGKAGGIKFADDGREAKEIAASLLGSNIKECIVGSLLVEERLDIAEQFYASIAIDRQARKYVALASTSGGIDIEEIARTEPDKIVQHRIDPINGFNHKDSLTMLNPFHLKENVAAGFAQIINTLYQATQQYDAELAELNPLLLTPAGDFITADARIIIDDNAIFRQADFKERNLLRADDTPREAEARKQRLEYVDLEGDIGIVGNGAGLVMATIDLVQTMGGRPGNFLDIGGGGDIEITKKGIMFVMSKPEIKVVFVNAHGGITRCDVVAQAVAQALGESEFKKPMVVRLMGTNEEEGVRILEKIGVNSFHEMEEAAAEVVRVGD